MNPLEFIKQLEKENSIKAEEVILEKIKDFSFDRSITFTIRNDELVGLCLRGLEISSLNNLLFFNDSLEVLNLNNNNLIEINELESFNKLVWIYLGHNEIVSIKPINKLRSLTNLYLGSNQITDILPLKRLVSLTELDLSSNTVSDIQPLDKLINLTRLDLSSNKISDLLPLDILQNLAELDLNSNQISNINSLDKLINLTRLNLSSNRISEINSLEKLKSLTRLNVSSNQISNIQPLEKLSSLTWLILSFNQFTDVQPLANLASLTELEISDNQIADVQPLAKLTSLIKLNVSSNQISDIQPLEKLSSLITLYLNFNQISDIQPLEELSSLTSLDLDSNQISDLQPLAKLSSLIRLFLSSNQIANVHPLEKLSNLTTLFLGFNQITNVQPLEKLNNLTTLFLGSSQITNVQPLEKLSSLTLLYLNSNQITDVQPLSKLTSLTTLFLGSNQISDVQLLAELSSLTKLDVSSNQITDVQPLEKLTSLTELDVSSNQITDVQPLEKLTSLTRLDISDNQITDIQPLAKLSNLTELDVSDNPFVEISKLSLSDDGSEQLQIIKEYLSTQDITEVTIPLPTKVLLLGNSNIGKTCLRLFLTNSKTRYCKDQSKENSSTHILDISTWKNKNASIWDFGGQDYYHSVHHLFFTLSSIYVILYDAQTNENKYLEDVDKNHFNFTLDYWLANLKYIRPDKKETKSIFLVENKIDIPAEEPVFVPQQENLNSYKISLCNNNQEINKEPSYLTKNKFLKAEIENQLTVLNKENQIKIPEIYQEIVEKLKDKTFGKLDTPTKKKFYYTKKTFKKRCIEIAGNSKKLTAKQKKELPLNLIISQTSYAGLLLNYDDNKLKEDVWLYPNLLIDQIHKLLSQEEIKKSNGLLTENQIENLKKDHLYDLLKAQEVIFKDGDKYVFPQYLPVTATSNLYHIAKTNLKPAFTLQFDAFLPSAFMSRVLCRFGKNENPKNEHVFYKRYEIIFTDIVENQEVRIWIKTDLEKLAVQVFISEIDTRNRDIYLNYLFKALIIAYQGKEEHLSYEKYKNGELNLKEYKNSGSKDEKINKDRIEHVDLLNLLELKKSNWLNHGFLKTIVPNDLNIIVNNYKAKFSTLSELTQNFVKVINLTDNDNELMVNSSIFNAFTPTNIPAPKKIFISYAHKDYKYLERIETHLSALRREYKIEDWNDTKFELGDHWNEKIKSKLKQSDIVILLISADFINSDFIHNVELPIIKKMEENGTCKVLPILVEECDWEYLDFIADIQIYPYYLDRKIENTELDLPKPIQEWEFKPQAYAQIIKKIRDFVKLPKNFTTRFKNYL